MRPSTYGRASTPTVQPPGQSSAAHTIVGETSSGTVHGVAVRPSSTRPGNRRSPSPGARSGPQTKHVGNGCDTKPGYCLDATVAAAKSTGGTSSASTSAGAASATVSPSGSTTLTASASRTTESGVSSGGGRRSVTTVPAGRSTSAATVPADQPPLPESRGPLYRAAITTVLLMPVLASLRAGMRH